MTENYQKIGQVIYNAADGIAKAGKEINALTDRFHFLFKKEMVTRKLVEDNGIKSGYIGKKYDDYKWVCLDTVVNFGITWVDDDEQSGWLAIQFSLLPDVDQFPGAAEPLLHILYTTTANGWGADNFKWDWKDDSFLYLEFNKLQTWVDEKGDKTPLSSLWEKEWAFSVPLTSINTTEDLRTQLIEPIIAIFSNEDIKGAFSRADKLLKFKVEENSFIILEPIASNSL